MNVLEEINKDLEAKAKKLEEDIVSAVEYNNRLREELEALRREERLTLSWLMAYSVKSP